MLVCGALAIGFAPVFAALALDEGFGPAAIGFYRVFFALPFMWLVLLAAPGKAEKSARTRRPTGLLALAGFFFAIDLVSWHWSIKYTTVANATLLANFASLWVTLWAGRLFGERIAPSFFVALGLAFVGGAILMGTTQLNGWLVLLGLALVSHFAGQGLIAYAFGHLPAALTSLNLLLQPVFAAALGWVLLDQALGGQQLLGAAIVLGALFFANRPAKAK